jgi:hypothetical protein
MAMTRRSSDQTWSSLAPAAVNRSLPPGRRSGPEIPGLGVQSTAITISCIVVLVVSIMLTTALLVRRRVLYQRRGAELKQEAEEAARVSDLRVASAPRRRAESGSETVASLGDSTAEKTDISSITCSDFGTV